MVDTKEEEEEMASFLQLVIGDFVGEGGEGRMSVLFSFFFVSLSLFPGLRLFVFHCFGRFSAHDTTGMYKLRILTFSFFFLHRTLEHFVLIPEVVCRIITIRAAARGTSST